MFTLSTDVSFHFELVRCLAHARYEGSDVADILSVVDQIRPGNFDDWHAAFVGLAQRTEAQAASLLGGKEQTASSRISLRDRMFAAAGYYRAADFFLHGRPEDPRIKALWERQAACFDRGLALLEYEARRHTLRAADDSFDVPIIFYKSNRPGPRPTFVMGNGYDGAQEELLHVCGLAALQRGYNVISYEGPGQCTPVRTQHIGFIPDWERAVSPVLDFALARPEVDGSRVALFGYSLGGLLAVRAAAFEPRLAAVVACDGVYDFRETVDHFMPPEILSLYTSGDRAGFDRAYRELANSGEGPAGPRWGLQQALWGFCSTSPSDVMDRLGSFSLKGLADRIKCKVFVGQAEHDIFFQGQPQRVKEDLGDRATLRYFGSEESAGGHCQVGAAVVLNQAMFEWLDEVM